MRRHGTLSILPRIGDSPDPRGDFDFPEGICGTRVTTFRNVRRKWSLYSHGSEHVSRSRTRKVFPYSNITSTSLRQSTSSRLCDGSRFAKPDPPSAEYHLQRVIQTVDFRIPDLTRLVASALVLDAFPPGMHEAFLSQVESAFTSAVLKNRAYKLKSASSHAHYLRFMGSTTADVDLTGTCVFCLLRRPIFTLDCHHQLCSCCVGRSRAG
ncbi:hypothetical protein F5883DRAFT_186166 [Diaporthe sp. PMI_573]|nr:hypothetical protein F5883DRAFT_186166 [Diaporthaceae sp. PMI_573]